MTWRRAVAATRSLAALVVAAGCANQTTWITPPAPVTAGPINGLLLDGRNRPLPGQIVAVGGEKTTSDPEGQFAFATTVPVTYDLVIASPDRGLATVYQGLTRRDPTVVVEAAPGREPVHKATIAVTLAGVDAAQGRWLIYFASTRASERPRPNAPDKTGPSEPLQVEWSGIDTVSGVVIALLMRQENLSIPLAMFAKQAVSLHAGQTATVELRPSKAPVVRRPSSIVELPKEDPGFDPHYTEEYRLPGVGFATHGPRKAQVPYDIPDLSAYGLQLCAQGSEWNPYLNSDRVQCGVAPGKQTTVTLTSPPVFKSPVWNTSARPGLSFTWTPVPGAVYRLSLSSGAATSAEPQIDIVTARPEAAWPDLHAVGVGFPEPLAYYNAVVETHGPFVSMDDLVSPQGLVDPTPRDRWHAASKRLSILVEPPLGKEEVACVFKETIFCGAKPTGEPYLLSLINRKIRRFPAFAAAARLHCVRDCEGARMYTKIYREYREAHPGFDENDHNTPNDDEPEMTPDMFEGRRAWSGGR